MAYTKYSLTPANNTAAPPDGAPEGMLPSAVNDTMRDMMAQIRDVGDGVRDGTYTMTAPKITGGTITGVTLTGNTFSSPVISGGTINSATIGATTASTGAFTTLSTSSTTTLSGLTASTALALDSSKNVVSVTNTGTGNNVLSASPTLTGTIAGASLSLSSLTSGRVTYAGASGLLSDSSKLTFDTSNLTVGVIGLTANADGATGKLVLRKPNEAVGNNQITRMLDFAPYYPGFDEAVVKASIFSGVDTGTQNGQLGFMVATGGVLYEKIRLLANGNFGIGTSSPSYKLSIAGDSATSSNILLTHNTDATGAYSRIRFQFAEGNTSIASEIRNIQRVAGNTGSSLGFYTESTAGALAQNMVIDYAGNVGINTTNPDYGSYGATERILGVTGVATNRGRLSLQNTSTGTSGVAGTVAFFNGSTTLAAIDVNADGATNKGLFAFNTNNGTSFSERMRIDSSGNLLVGTTSSTGNGGVFQAKNNVNGSAAYFEIVNSQGGNQNAIDIVSVTNAAFRPLRFYVNGYGVTEVGSISCTTSATAYNTSSDYRLKENIAPMTGALAKVAQLKPVTYKWKSNGSDGQGFIAHELAEVVPDCVTGEKDAVDKNGKPVYQGVDTSFLVATLTKAIQEQQALIESLTTRLTNLENK